MTKRPLTSGLPILVKKETNMNVLLSISQAFLELCEEKPLKKISVSDIVDKAGKNRKTFYYHFENKEHLIIWIFRYDLGQVLTQHFPESVLVYEKDNGDPVARFPYYITQKSGVRSFDHAEFFQCFAQVLEGRKRFYAQAFESCEPNSLKNYLYQLYTTMLKRDINFILANRFMPQRNIDFLAEFYTSAFLDYFVRKTSTMGPSRGFDNIEPFGNIIHDTLEFEIREAQLQRNL